MKHEHESDRPDEDFVDALRRQLRDSEMPDAVTRARLAAARHRAVDAADTRPRWSWALPGSAAVAALLALAVLPWRPGAPPPADLATVEVLDVLTDEMDPDFYCELELYEWLEWEATRA